MTDFNSFQARWQLGFDDVLNSLKDDRSLSKGERTRWALLASASNCLVERPREPLTVEAVIAPLSVARGTFYKYFDDVQDIVRSVVDEFHRYVWKSPRFRELFENKFEVAYATNLYLCRSFALNGGLYTARTTAADGTIAALHEKVNADWSQVVLRSLLKAELPVTLQSQKDALGVIRILIAMVDESLNEHFVRKDKTMRRAFRDADALARGLTLIWCTVLYGRSPSAEETANVDAHPFFARPGKRTAHAKAATRHRASPTDAA